MELFDSWMEFTDLRNDLKISPTHHALAFYIINLNIKQKSKKAGFIEINTLVTMERLRIFSYNTYKKILKDLISFGFIEIFEKGFNQYSNTKIVITNFKSKTNF